MEHYYGEKLYPEHSLRIIKGIKGTRPTEIASHDPSIIDHDELLLVEFANLGHDDVIIKGIVNLSFNIELSLMADPKRVLVSNIGRTIVKTLSFKSGRMLYLTWMILTCWHATETCGRQFEKWNAVRQGITIASAALS